MVRDLRHHEEHVVSWPKVLAQGRHANLIAHNVAFPQQSRNDGSCEPAPYARRISLSEAASRRLRFPASAMPSSSPLFSVQIPEKPIPTS